MSLLSFIKRVSQNKAAGKSKQDKPKPYVSPCADLPKVPEYTHIQLKTLFTGMDGSLQELSNDTILQDGTCLIPVNGHYYHRHVGCSYKGNGSLKMVTIKGAEKLGYMPCMVCEDTIANELTFESGVLEENKDQED